MVKRSSLPLVTIVITDVKISRKSDARKNLPAGSEMMAGAAAVDDGAAVVISRIYRSTGSGSVKWTLAKE